MLFGILYQPSNTLNGGEQLGSKKKTAEKKKGRSTQELVGIKTFTKYGLETNKNELLFLSRRAYQYIGVVPYERRNQNPPLADGTVCASKH